MKYVFYIFMLSILFACSKQTSDEHLDDAKSHIKAQEYDVATIALKNAIKQSPELAEARFLLGKVYVKTHQYQSAEKELNRALSLDYPTREVVPLLSLAYQKNKSDIALLDLSHYDKGLSVDQKTEVAFYKIQAMFRLEKIDKAMELIEEIQQLGGKSVFTSLSQVYSLLIEQQFDAAQQQMMLITLRHPKQSDALKLQAFLYAKQGDVEEAATVYLEYLSYYPEDLETAFITARLLVEINRTVEAEPIIDRLLAINEDHGLLNQLKGIVRFIDKDSKSALLYTEKAITASPADPALRLLAGYSAYQQKNYETAQRHLSIIAEDVPATHHSLRILAISQLRLGLTEEAGETVGSLAELNDKDNVLVSSIGLALVQSGEINKAHDILTKSKQLTAETADALTRLGLLKLSLNDVAGIANLESALAKEPAQEFTRNTLATAYLSTKQFVKTHALATRWKNSNPQDPQAFLLAGAAYIQQHEFAKAKQEYQQILAFDETHLAAQLALVELALKEKDHLNAEQGIKSILAQQPDYIPGLIKFYLFEKQREKGAEALTIIEQQYQANPENKNLQLLLGKIYFHEQHLEKSVALLEGFEQPNPPKIYWQTLGQAYFKLQMFSKLKTHFQQWLNQSPNDRDAILSNLILLDKQRQFSQALTISTDYLNQHEEDTEIQLFHIHFLLAVGDIESAKTKLALITEPAKSLPFTKGLLGQVELSENKFSDALLNLQQAYQQQKTSRNARLIYQALFLQEEKEQAYQFLQLHVNDRPNDVASLMQLAELQVVANTDEAIKNYEHVLSFSDKNFVALNNLAYFYLQRKQLDKALEHAENALKIKPDMPDVLDTVGRIYLAKKDYQTAVKHLSKAVSGDDKSEEIYLNYIEALLLNDNKVLAKRKIEQRTFTQPQSLIRVIAFQKRFEI